jgi:hypothetical protein
VPRLRRCPDLSPRDPSGSALHAVVRDHLATFLRERDDDAPLPGFITDELRGLLDCGVLAKGCAHFACGSCGLDRVVGLSCKGRGFCPRCAGRRMTETARHLAERVVPEVRTRQWVLSFPFQLRWALAFHHELVKALARLTYAEIARRYLRLARGAGVVSPRGGAFFVIQRFGSDLRLNVHLHALFLDGAFGKDDAFFIAPAPSPREVEAILARIVARANELLEARADALSITDDEPALAHAHREATSRRGAVKHAPDHDELDGQVILPTRRKARIDGFDLDAEVAVAAHDHERREGLLRYFLRPPLSHDRLRYLPSPGGGVVILQLKKPWQDRTTHIELTPSAFLTRLASLVPRPRKNTSLYFGVLAANAKRRKKIVRKTERTTTRKEDASWAALMKHSFGLDVLGCPRAGCKGRLTLVAVIFDRDEVKRLLEHLRLFTEPIPMKSARDPPELWTEAYDFD